MASVGTVAVAGTLGAIGTSLAPSTAVAQAGATSAGTADLFARNVRIADGKPLVDIAISKGRGSVRQAGVISV